MSDLKSSCDVCRGMFTVEESTAWMQLCDDHHAAVSMRIAEQALRTVIPAGLHHARPSDLPSGIADWSAQDGTGLYFYGGVGVGKSHAAAALLKKGYMELYNNGMNPMPGWLNVPSAIVATMNAASRRTSEAGLLWDNAQRATILVLDDIGMEAPRDWIRMRLYGLIEHRLHHRLPTLVTSNLDLAQLAEHLDSPQIASRLSQMTAQVSFKGRKDRRPDLGPSIGA